MTGDISWNINAELECLDWHIDPATGDIATTGSLESAVIISLFTDKRAPETWTRTEDKRGWCLHDADDEYEMGSLLWTLWYIPTQTTDDYTNLVKGMVEDSLRWLIDENIVQTIDVTVTMVTTDACQITINLIQPTESSQYSYMWSPSAISGEQSGSIGGIIS